MLRRGVFTFLLSILVCLPVLADTGNTPMPASQAFQLQVQFDKTASNRLILHWQMAPGYYLYHDSLRATVDAKPAAHLGLPPPIFKKDIEDGSEAIYANEVNAALPLAQSEGIANLVVYYQGCSKSGFCYPPTKKQYDIDITNRQITQIDSSQTAASNFSSFLTDQYRTQQALSSEHLLVTLSIFLGLGILLAFTPCVLPMVPILVSIIAGHKQRGAVGNKHIFALCLSYVLGMAVTYALVGVVAALFGGSIQVWLQKPLFILLGSLLFVLLGLSLFGLFELYLFKRAQNTITNWARHLKGGSYVGVFSMGVLSVLLISPCTTAPLIGVLLYISQTGNMLLGASTLFVMGMGMGLPLLIAGMSADKWLPHQGPWMEWIKRFFGVLMIGMAVWMVARIDVFGTKMNVVHIADGQFTSVQTLQDFDKQLTLSSQSGRPLILDFYADWCEACLSMEKNVFNNRAVTAILSPFTRLRINLTANTANDEMLMKHFNVIAPPTVLFFDEHGKEVDSKRIVGEVNANEFIQRVDTFFAAGCNKSATC